MVTALWVLYLLLCIRGMDAWQTAPRLDKMKCQKITVPMRRTNSSKYDQTRLPKFIGFTTQTQVDIFTKKTQMQELVKTKCSRDLVFFLCSVLVANMYFGLGRHIYRNHASHGSSVPKHVRKCLQRLHTNNEDAQCQLAWNVKLQWPARS